MSESKPNVATRDDPREVIVEPKILTEELLTFPDGTRATRSELESGETAPAEAPDEEGAEAPEQDTEKGEEASEDAEGSQEEEETAAEAVDDADEARRARRRQERRERREARRHREQELRERLAAAEARLAEVESKGETKAEESADARPRMDDFEDPEEWAEAFFDWRERQKGSEAKSEAKGDETPAAPAEVPEELHEFYSQGAARYDDFRDVVGAQDLMITQGMAEFMFDSEVGADIAYHLGQNKDEASKIAKMDAASSIRALARLEAKVSAPKGESTPEKGAPRARRVTKAADPITPVQGGGNEAPKSPERMSQEEYNAWRSKQRRAQGLY